jgi:hypothetical protein
MAQTGTVALLFSIVEPLRGPGAGVAARVGGGSSA